jgi:phospholipid/cholesterol/gamma-HCH transport system ATP-binding protein
MPPLPLLEFRSVAVEPQRAHDSGVWNVSFTLNQGDLLLLRLEPGQSTLPLCDAASGIVDPAQGEVRFMGVPWQDRSPKDAARARSTIGRTFADGGWLANLDTDENITLAQRHHTTRPAHELFDEALELSRRFGLPGLPRSRPWTMRTADLARAACTRAFMGTPTLLLLEEPTLGIYPDAMAPLMNALRRARDRGAAALWTTSDPRVWRDPGLRPTQRFTMSGAQMLTAGAEP